MKKRTNRKARKDARKQKRKWLEQPTFPIFMSGVLRGAPRDKGVIHQEPRT